MKSTPTKAHLRSILSSRPSPLPLEEIKDGDLVSELVVFSCAPSSTPSSLRSSRTSPELTFEALIADDLIVTLTRGKPFSFF
jgi:hypothetical protein